MINHADAEKDIDELLSGNSSGVRVWSNEFCPRTASAKSGYITWDLDFDYVEDSSLGMSSVAEADLMVTVYAQRRQRRQELITDVLDLLTPIKNGKRLGIGPVQLSNIYLVNIYVDGPFHNIYAEKEGHPQPDVPGIMIPFRLKATNGE